MRLFASLAILSLSLSFTSAASASSGLTRKLWILNQQGATYLSDFFQCVLGGTNWNDLANTYSAGETIVFGGMVQRNDAPCTGGVGSTGFYQCAANAGNFDVAQYDVLLVVIPDSGYGGQNGTATLTNPKSGASATVNVAFVRTSPDPIYQTIYGGHEVFEAQTDGVSADCCDGETASGGPMNWCSQCGPYDNGQGACGKYAGGGAIGTLGIDTIACPNATYHYQRVSPASHEFDGTCDAIAAKVTPNNPCANVSAANSGVYCGTSNQNGFAGGSPNTLYDCQNGWVGSTKTCANGCFIAPSGQADGCNAAAAPDAGAATDAGVVAPHDAATRHPDAAAGPMADASADPVADASAGAQDDAGSGGPTGPGNLGSNQGEADGAANGASASATSGESGGCSVGAGESPAALAWLVAAAAALCSRRRRRRVSTGCCTQSCTITR
jgi:MYXO-CTERM domain-containing protein